MTRSNIYHKPSYEKSQQFKTDRKKASSKILVRLLNTLMAELEYSTRFYLPLSYC